MGNFDFLAEYRSGIMDKIVQNNNIAKLLVYTDDAPLSKDNLDEWTKKDLQYKSVFPYRFVDNMANDESSYVNLGMRFVPYRSGRLKLGKITITILCHKNLFRTKDGLRPDLILNEIDKMFNGSTEFSAGTLVLSLADEYAYGDNHRGWIISYNSQEI